MSFNEYTALLTLFTALLTLFTIVVGWLVNSYLQRNHEITKKRMNYRIDMLKNYLLFYKKAYDNKSLIGIDDIQVSFLIYGYDDEINLINEILKTVKEQPNDQKKWLDKLIKLNILSRNRLRVELQLPEIKVRKV